MQASQVLVLNNREVSAESDSESLQLQNHWSEVRYLVRCIYRQTGTPLADDHDQPLERDKEGMKELVDRYRCFPSVYFVLLNQSSNSRVGGKKNQITTTCKWLLCLDLKRRNNEKMKKLRNLKSDKMHIRVILYKTRDDRGIKIKIGRSVKSLFHWRSRSYLLHCVSSHRLCEKDPFQLYQRLEQQAREYVLEMRVRLLKHLATGTKGTGPAVTVPTAQSPPQAYQFVSMLLEEYSTLCQAARTISGFLLTLVS